MQILTYARRLFVAVLFAAMVFPQLARPTDFDIRGINFKRGLPRLGDNLERVVVEPSADSMAILQQVADVLNRYPEIQVTIVGFTDNQECDGKECISLSFLRAKYVDDWLIKHGVSKLQLFAPVGKGNADPISDNKTEEGRAFNRRIEPQVLGAYKE